MSLALTTILIFFRLMTNPLIAYGFFLLATYRPPRDQRRLDSPLRVLFGICSIYFLIFTLSIILRSALSLALAVQIYDATITPVVIALMVVLYATIYYEIFPDHYKRGLYATSKRKL